MIVEWNAKKLHNVNKNLGEMMKVFQGFRNPKRVVTSTFSRKLQKTTKELDLDHFKTKLSKKIILKSLYLGQF